MLVRDSASVDCASDSVPEQVPEQVSDWGLVHERIVGLGKDRAKHERELCRWLLAAERLGVHARMGCASLNEYAERVVGLTARQVEERLRAGRALMRLPTRRSLRARSVGRPCVS